jgi:hypothetical protein
MVWLPVLGGLKTAARGQSRGYEYAVSWAMPPGELVDLFVPTFSGLLDNYWGTNPFKQHTEYFGLLTIVLAVFAAGIFWKRSMVKFFLGSAAAAILTALGGATPFFRILYILIPGFKLTRAPALIFFLASFSIVVLAAIGFEYAVVKREMDRKKFLSGALAALGIFILMIIVGAAAGPGLAGAKTKLFEMNGGAFTQGILLGFLLIMLTIGTVFLSLRRKLNTSYTTLIIIGLSLVSLIPLMSKFLPRGPKPEIYYAADDIVRFLKNDRSTFRVFPLYYSHAGDCYLLYHDLQSAGGYIPNPIQRYQDYIGAGVSVMFNPQGLIQYPRLVDLLNLKYVLCPNLPDDKDIGRYEPDVQRVILRLKDYLSRYRPVFRDTENSVFINDSVLPRAYIVADYRITEGNKVLDILKSPGFDPRTEVVLEDDPGLPHAPAKLPMTEANIVSYEANRVVCQTDGPVSGFLVLADNWHPDWRAFVDGKPVKLYRANYLFRSVYVPVGRHEVVFAFVSQSFNTGKIITILSLIAALALIVLPAVIKKRVPVENKPS